MTRCSIVLLLLTVLLLPAHVLSAQRVADPAAVSNEQSRLAIPETNDGLPGVGPIRRYDWFKGLWNRRRGQWAQAVAADQRSLVFLGDSITQGWGDEMGGSFPGVKVANRGISGDTTRGMLLRLQDDVLA